MTDASVCSRMPTALGAAIRAKRSANGLGLREVARLAKVSATYLSRIETGAEQSPPSEAVLARLAYEIDPDTEADELLALAGRVPEDVMVILRRGGPALWSWLRTEGP